MQTCALLTFFRIINLRIPDLLRNFALIYHTDMSKPFYISAPSDFR